MTENAGWWSSPTLTGHEPEGARANLTYQSAASCVSIGGNHNAGYSGWVMINGNNSTNKYAQAGFEFNGNPLDCIRHFSQWDNAGAVHSQTGSCVSAGQVHTPLVQYVPSSGYTEMWIDYTLFDTMPVCSCYWPHPLMTNYMGEDGNISGDVPGLAAHKTDWNSMQIQYYTDDSWHGTCSTITLYKLITNSRYAADAPACNHVRSWTAQT